MKTPLLIGAAATVSILWAISAIIQKHLLDHMSCETMLFLVGLFFGIISIFLGIAYQKKISADLFREPVLDKLPLVVLMVFLGYFLANWTLFRLLDKHSCYLVVSMTYTTPLFVLLFSYFLLNEKITWLSALGVALIVSGIWLL